MHSAPMKAKMIFGQVISNCSWQDSIISFTQVLVIVPGAKTSTGNRKKLRLNSDFFGMACFLFISSGTESVDVDSGSFFH